MSRSVAEEKPSQIFQDYSKVKVELGWPRGKNRQQIFLQQTAESAVSNGRKASEPSLFVNPFDDELTKSQNNEAIKRIESLYGEDGKFSGESTQEFNQLRRVASDHDTLAAAHGIARGNRQRRITSNVMVAALDGNDGDVGLGAFDYEKIRQTTFDAMSSANREMSEFAVDVGRRNKVRQIYSQSNVVKFINTLKTDGFADVTEEVVGESDEDKSGSKARLTKDEFKDLINGPAYLEFRAIAQGVFEARQQIEAEIKQKEDEAAKAIQTKFRGNLARKDSVKRNEAAFAGMISEFSNSRSDLDADESIDIDAEELKKRAKSRSNILVADIVGDGETLTTVTNYGLTVFNYDMLKFEHRFRDQSSKALATWSEEQATGAGLYTSSSGDQKPALVSVTKHLNRQRYENGELSSHPSEMYVVKTVTERGFSTTVLTVNDFEIGIENPLKQFRERLVRGLRNKAESHNLDSVVETVAGVSLDKLDQAIAESSGENKQYLTAVRGFKERTERDISKRVDAEVKDAFKGLTLDHEAERKEFMSESLTRFEKAGFPFLLDALEEKSVELEKRRKKAAESSDEKELTKLNADILRVRRQIEKISDFKVEVTKQAKEVTFKHQKPLSLDHNQILKGLISQSGDTELAKEIRQRVVTDYSQSFADNFMVERTARAIEKGAAAIDLTPENKDRAKKGASANLKAAIDLDLPVSAFAGVSFLNRGMNQISAVFNGKCPGNEISYMEIPGAKDVFVRAILCTESNTTKTGDKYTRTIYKSGKAVEIECKLGDVVMDENTVCVLRAGKFNPVAVSDSYEQYATQGENKNLAKLYNVGTDTAMAGSKLAKLTAKVVSAASLGALPTLINLTTLGKADAYRVFDSDKSALETECGAEKAKNIRERFKKLQIKVASDSAVVTMADGKVRHYSNGSRIVEDELENKLKFEFDEQRKLKPSFGAANDYISKKVESGEVEHGQSKYFSNPQLVLKDGTHLYGCVSVTEGVDQFNGVNKDDDESYGRKKGNVTCKKQLYYKDKSGEYKLAAYIDDKGKAVFHKDYKALSLTGDLDKEESKQDLTKVFTAFCSTKIAVEITADSDTHLRWDKKGTVWKAELKEGGEPKFYDSYPEKFNIEIAPGSMVAASAAFQKMTLFHEATRLMDPNNEISDISNGAKIDTLQEEYVRTLRQERAVAAGFGDGAWVRPSSACSPISVVEFVGNQAPENKKSSTHAEEVLRTSRGNDDSGRVV